MFDQPVFQESHHFVRHHDLAIFEFLLQLQNLLNQLGMFRLVSGQTRIGMGRQHPLFIIEMRGRIIYKPA